MWLQVSLRTDNVWADAISEALTDCGALSVSLEDDGDQPLFEPKPGETPIWKTPRLVALFEDSANIESIKTELGSQFDDHEFDDWQVSVVEDRAWEREWLEHFRPMQFGEKLWIVPTGFDAPSDPNAVCISLDPGLAFGTGTHPTTALCLEWLDAQPWNESALIDFGCGSGILAIAALRLGASSVRAVDIDPQALLATNDNAEKNHVEHKITCYFPADLPNTQADYLVANILANPLIELAPRFAELVTGGGRIALSGILEEQMHPVVAAYQCFFTMNQPRVVDGWALLTGVRNPG